MAPARDGLLVAGGQRSPPDTAGEAQVRSCATIWSITDAWVMNTIIRVGPEHVGHAGCHAYDLLA